MLGTYDCTYQPDNAGLHDIAITLDGVPIKGYEKKQIEKQNKQTEKLKRKGEKEEGKKRKTTFSFL